MVDIVKSIDIFQNGCSYGVDRGTEEKSGWNSVLHDRK